MRKYAIKLKRTGQYAGAGNRATSTLSEAMFRDTQAEAEEYRAGLNDLWRRQGIIVPVQVTEVPPVIREFTYTELDD